MISRCTELSVPGEATGARCVEVKGSGFGGLCQFLLSWLDLDGALVFRSTTAPGIIVYLPCPGWL